MSSRQRDVLGALQREGSMSTLDLYLFFDEHRPSGWRDYSRGGLYDALKRLEARRLVSRRRALAPTGQASWLWELPA